MCYNCLDSTRDESVLTSRPSWDLCIYTSRPPHFGICDTYAKFLNPKLHILLYAFLNPYIQYNICHNIQDNTQQYQYCHVEPVIYVLHIQFREELFGDSEMTVIRRALQLRSIVATIINKIFFFIFR